MVAEPLIFDLDFGTGIIRVEELFFPGQTFFRVSFSNDIPDLTLLRATNFHDERFWTSIPEGRQKLAEEIGPLIENYYRSKVK